MCGLRRQQHGAACSLYAAQAKLDALACKWVATDVVITFAPMASRLRALDARLLAPHHPIAPDAVLAAFAGIRLPEAA